MIDVLFYIACPFGTKIHYIVEEESEVMSEYLDEQEWKMPHDPNFETGSPQFYELHLYLVYEIQVMHLCATFYLSHLHIA